ncbi:hypothetical protein FBEOM_5395 [Fusarium beomiforme]|uniref:Uncharacterized protein n=1 Tax=Fusarium beomiforme TaxID=44412 RepID=A0A9P5DZN5_9HYPO|nr:hypothetical protein FBEOM_5395 [Fusarium beomiforme]
MPPPHRLPHRQCKSEEPQNTGTFQAPWVGGYAETKDRHAYMFAYLNWMRGETREVEELFVKSFSVYERGRFFDFVVHLWVWLIWLKDMSPLPEFPWVYSGGAPQPRKKNYWKNKTKELQTEILQRLGPFHSMRRNRMFRDVSSLFCIESLLCVDKPVTKNERGDEVFPGTWPDEQESRDVPSSCLDQDTDLSPNLSMQECSSPILEPGDICISSSIYQNHSSVAQESNQSQREGGHSESERRNPVPNQPSCQQLRISPLENTRSVLSASFERFSNMSARLYCVEDENFDVQTIAWLLIALGDDDSRQCLFYFLDNASMGIWYCLGDVVSQSLRLLTELGSSQEACVTHGLLCKRVMVVEGELGSRRLKFQRVQRDE